MQPSVGSEAILAAVRVVLCQTSHPGNIGACARAMKTMGLQHLCLVEPRHFPHPEAEAMASRATDILERAQVCATLDEALAGTVFAVASTARDRDLSHQVFTPREAGARMVAEAGHGPVAIVLGSEKFGMTTEQVNRCSAIVTIPANPDYSSLNLASALQIFAYEVRLAALDPRPTQLRAHPPATRAQMEAFYAHLEQTMLDLHFLDPQQPRRLMQRLRRLFERARVEREEFNILRGVLAAAQEAARKAGKAD
jgi:tRNA/rRNA methyltransferase